MNQSINLPPQAIEAEQSLLGSLMLSDIYSDVADIVNSDDFYRNDHKLIFSAITELSTRGKNIDIVTVSEVIERNGESEKLGGLSYLAGLAKNTPNSNNHKTYARIVKEKSGLRKIINLANDMQSKCYHLGEDSIDDIVAMADKGIESILNQSTALEARPLKDFMEPALNDLDRHYMSGGGLIGTPTFIEPIDAITCGLEGGEVYVLAARPSMGKTAMMLSMIKSIVMNDGKALAISMEMPIKQLITRLWSSFGVDHGKLRSGVLNAEEWSKITAATSKLIEANCFVEESPALDVHKINLIVRKAIKKHGKMPVFIDYLQIMGGGEGSSRYEKVTGFIGGVKAIAKNLDVPIVVLSQLSRNLESRPDKRPIMSDLRESGAIEQDAGTIMFLYRDQKYNPDSEFGDTAELIIEKNRNGENSTIPMIWEGHFQRFLPCDKQKTDAYWAKRNSTSKPSKGGLN